MDEFEKVRSYKDRIRIFLILYIFGEDYTSADQPHLKKIFNTETRLQKIDFLLRNPDYLALELLQLVKDGIQDKAVIKQIIKSIFQNEEPSFRRLDMEKFFFGAYEDIDDTIAFLKGIGFISFSSTKSLNLKTIDKKYFVTDYAIKRVEGNLPQLSSLQWYVDRCNLIKNYFGDKTGSELRKMQYEIDEYKETTWKDCIKDVQEKVKAEFFELYGETL